MNKLGSTEAVLSSAQTSMPSVDATALMKISERTFRNGAETQITGVDRMLRISQGYLKFLTRRLDHDRTFFSDLAAIKNPLEVPSLWGGFFETAQNDYAAEGERVLKDLIDITSQLVAETQSEVLEVVGNAAEAEAIAEPQEPQDDGQPAASCPASSAAGSHTPT